MNFWGVLLLIGLAHAKVRYDGHKIVDITLETEEQVEDLNRIRPTFALDFWNEPIVGQKAKVLVKPESESLFLNMLQSLNIQSEIVVEDVQKHLDEEYEENVLSTPIWGRNTQSPIGQFASYNNIKLYLNTLCKKFEHAECMSLGKSYENRDIPLVKISSGKADKSIFIDGGIHAREWLSQATVMYVLDKMIRNYGSDPAITKAIDSYDWYITPVLNPDGYVYTHNGERFWRKTRTEHNKFCKGADPNRNFNYPTFGGSMTSNNPCDEIYHGPYAFSEPCVARFRDFHLANQMDMYFSFHAYSQLLFVPWAYTKQRPKDAKEMDRVAYIGQKAIEDVNGIKFTVGTPGQILYAAGSSSIDWVKGTAGVKYAYGAELRPGMGANMGFVINKKFIPKSGEEILAGLLAMSAAAKF